MGFGFGDDRVEMFEDFRDTHGVHFAARVVALFDDLLEVAAGDLCGQLIGDDHAGAFLLLHPGGAWQGDPHGAAVHVVAHVDRIGVAGGDGHNVCLPLAGQVFAAPAVGDVEIFVHGVRVSFREGGGQAGVGVRRKDNFVLRAIPPMNPVKRRAAPCRFQWT